MKNEFGLNNEHEIDVIINNMDQNGDKLISLKHRLIHYLFDELINELFRLLIHAWFD